MENAMVQLSVVLFLEKGMIKVEISILTFIQRTQCQAVGPKNKAQDLLHIRKKIQSLGGEQK